MSQKPLVPSAPPLPGTRSLRGGLTLRRSDLGPPATTFVPVLDQLDGAVQLAHLQPDLASAAWALIRQVAVLEPEPSGVGLWLADAQGNLQLAAASSTLVVDDDLRQGALGEGPAVAAWISQRVERSGPVADARRWPRWAGRTLPSEVQSVISAPVVATTGPVGVCAAYRSAPPTLSQGAEEQLRQLVGRSATVLAAWVPPADGRFLDTAYGLTRRHPGPVQRARRLVMEHFRVSSGVASALLASEARASRRPLREVAVGVLLQPDGPATACPPAPPSAVSSSRGGPGTPVPRL